MEIVGLMENLALNAMDGDIQKELVNENRLKATTQKTVDVKLKVAQPQKGQENENTGS